MLFISDNCSLHVGQVVIRDNSLSDNHAYLQKLYRHTPEAATK